MLSYRPGPRQVCPQSRVPEGLSKRVFHNRRISAREWSVITCPRNHRRAIVFATMDSMPLRPLPQAPPVRGQGAAPFDIRHHRGGGTHGVTVGQGATTSLAQAPCDVKRENAKSNEREEAQYHDNSDGPLGE